jgi:hypothetical protein
MIQINLALNKVSPAFTNSSSQHTLAVPDLLATLVDPGLQNHAIMEQLVKRSRRAHSSTRIRCNSRCPLQVQSPLDQEVVVEVLDICNAISKQVVYAIGSNASSLTSPRIVKSQFNTTMHLRHPIYPKGKRSLILQFKAKQS